MFACALDWPGWCRSGKNEDAALAALAAYAGRYAAVTREAAIAFPQAVTFDIVERLPGSAGYTDFGAPGALATRDRNPLTGTKAERQARLVQAAWAIFDGVAAAAPADLRKGRAAAGATGTR